MTPTLMRAIQVLSPGGADVLREESIPIPAAKAGEALIRVDYAGVNFIDVYKRKGLYKIPLPATVGEEGSGVVEALGGGVADLKVGDRVAWAGAAGSYAEHAVVPASKLVSVPPNVDMRIAAAVMLQGMTAHYLAVSTYPLKKDDRCIVHAAAGGVGLLLVQIAKRRGAYVIATAGSPEKLALAKGAGADEVVNYNTQDFVEETRRVTSSRGVNVVYDSVGKTTFLRGFDVLAPRGMMVLFGQSSGPVDPIDPQLLNQKGSVFLTRPTLGSYVATRDELSWRARELFEWIGKGELNVRVGAEYSLSEAAEAHRALEGRRTTGKVLLRIHNSDGHH
jgi:NADPH:quinone reductase